MFGNWYACTLLHFTLIPFFHSREIALEITLCLCTCMWYNHANTYIFKINSLGIYLFLIARLWSRFALYSRCIATNNAMECSVKCKRYIDLSICCRSKKNLLQMFPPVFQFYLIIIQMRHEFFFVLYENKRKELHHWLEKFKLIRNFLHRNSYRV